MYYTIFISCNYMSYCVAYVKDKNSGNKKMQRDWQVYLIHQFLQAISECQIIKGLKHYKYWRIVSLTDTCVWLYTWSTIYNFHVQFQSRKLIYKSFVLTRPVCDQPFEGWQFWSSPYVHTIQPFCTGSYPERSNHYYS